MNSSPPVLVPSRERREDEWPPDDGLTIDRVKLPLVVPTLPGLDERTVEVVAKSYRFRLASASAFEDSCDHVIAVSFVAEIAQQLIGGQLDESFLAFFFDKCNQF